MRDQSHEGRAPLVRALGVACAVLGALALVGAVLGAAWWALAPRAEGTALGGGEVFTGTTEDVFAGEGYFVLLTAAAGLITGYAAYMVQFPLTRERPQDLRLPVLVAGALGAAAAALLTWWVGTSLDGSVHEAMERAEPGESVTVGLQLEATAFLVAWPFVFVLQYGLLDALSMVRRDLPGHPEPSAEVLPPESPEQGPGRHETEQAAPEADPGPQSRPESQDPGGDPHAHPERNGRPTSHEATGTAEQAERVGRPGLHHGAPDRARPVNGHPERNGAPAPYGTAGPDSTTGPGGGPPEEGRAP